MLVSKKAISLAILISSSPIVSLADNYKDQINTPSYVETIEEANLLAEELADDGVWSDWATENNGQDRIGTVYCSEGSFVLGIDGRDQGGYGLIDLRIRCGITPSAWAIGNNADSQIVDTYTDGTNAYGMEVRDQGGYGLVDGLLVYGDLLKSDWMSGNPAGVVKRAYCPRGTDMAGLQVKDQGGYGLIDLRLYCRPN